MRKHTFAKVTSAAIAAAATIVYEGSADAITAIASCGTLDTFAASYVVTGDLTSCGPCLVVGNDRISIDLGKHTISGECEFGAGIGDGGETRQGTTIRNGTITGFPFGIDMGSSIRTEIRDIESSGNSAQGMRLGPRSLVKRCVVTDNVGRGIEIAEGGQVLECTVQGNGGVGIFAVKDPLNVEFPFGWLITQNTVKGNAVGIIVGEFPPDPAHVEAASTVSFNTTSENQFFGIVAGRRVLVTGNTADANDLDGISFGAFSTVSFNSARGNGNNGIDAGFEGLFDGSHSLITGNLTNDNGGAGVAAQCPSVVTNNRASGNAVQYSFDGQGCQETNNK